MFHLCRHGCMRFKAQKVVSGQGAFFYNSFRKNYSRYNRNSVFRAYDRDFCRQHQGLSWEYCFPQLLGRSCNGGFRSCLCFIHFSRCSKIKNPCCPKSLFQEKEKTRKKLKQIPVDHGAKFRRICNIFPVKAGSRNSTHERVCKNHPICLKDIFLIYLSFFNGIFPSRQ